MLFISFIIDFVLFNYKSTEFYFIKFKYLLFLNKIVANTYLVWANLIRLIPNKNEEK